MATVKAEENETVLRETKGNVLSTVRRGFASATGGSLFLALLAISSPSLGQVRAAVPLETPKWSAVDQAIGKEKYAEAKQKADAVLQRGTPEDRQKTMLVYGRILLGLGQKDQARQYLNMLSGGEKGSGRKGRPAPVAAGGQVAIYTAWLKALDGHSAEAVKTLEKMLEQSGGAPDETTAETADVLAMLYMAGGEREKAKKAVDFGLKSLQYQGVKGGYVLALLRGRLSSDIAAGEAKRLYNQAEKLRAEKKFMEAGQLFAQVRAAYPTNEWGHASGFRIGQCFAGLNRASQAVDWWQKFVKESPAGPWRGQAQVALVDAALEQLDLKKATQHAVAAGTVLAKELDKEAAPSWKEAVCDISLRQGIVSLIDGRFDAAVQGFQQAKQTLPSPSGRGAGVEGKQLPSPVLGRGAGGEGLDRLIAAAQQRAKVVPDELSVGNDRAATALALGNIYNVLRQYDLAKGYFSLLLSGPMLSHSAAHRSFAGLGLACAVIGSGKAISGSKSGPQPPPQLQAKALCQASLNEYPKGSWHDETLYRLATLIQDMAESKFGSPPKPPADGKNAGQPAKAENERRAALLKARAEALPCWQDLIRRYPNSPRCEAALYNAGVLLYEAAEAAPAGKSEQLCKDADSMFERLCQAFPKSPYVGDAFVHRIDFALERKYDMKLALSLADRGIEWAKQQKVEVLTAADGSLTQRSLADAAKAIRDSSAKLREWAEPGGKPPAELLNDLYNLYLRAGVVAYLQEKYDEARPFLDAAGPARPTEGMSRNFDHQKAGVFILMECARRKTPSWWPDAVNAAKSDSQKLAIKLADTYLHAQRAEKAEPIYDQVLAGGMPLGRANKAVEGYCLFQLALLYSEQGRDRDKSVAYYKKFLTKDYADLPYAADALLRLTVLEYNTNHDARRAVPQCRYIVAKYPAHREAERATYFLAQMAVEAGDKEVASSACKQFLAKYPQSGWKSHVEQMLNEEVPKLKDK